MKGTEDSIADLAFGNVPGPPLIDLLINFIKHIAILIHMKISVIITILLFLLIIFNLDRSTISRRLIGA